MKGETTEGETNPRASPIWEKGGTSQTSTIPISGKRGLLRSPAPAGVIQAVRRSTLPKLFSNRLLQPQWIFLSPYLRLLTLTAHDSFKKGVRTLKVHHLSSLWFLEAGQRSRRKCSPQTEEEGMCSRPTLRVNISAVSHRRPWDPEAWRSEHVVIFLSYFLPCCLLVI